MRIKKVEQHLQPLDRILYQCADGKKESGKGQWLTNDPTHRYTSTLSSSSGIFPDSAITLILNKLDLVSGSILLPKTSPEELELTKTNRNRYTVS